MSELNLPSSPEAIAAAVRLQSVVLLEGLVDIIDQTTGLEGFENVKESALRAGGVIASMALYAATIENGTVSLDSNKENGSSTESILVAHTVDGVVEEIKARGLRVNDSQREIIARLIERPGVKMTARELAGEFPTDSFVSLRPKLRSISFGQFFHQESTKANAVYWYSPSVPEDNISSEPVVVNFGIPEAATPTESADEINRLKHAQWGLDFKVYEDESSPAVYISGKRISTIGELSELVIYLLSGKEPKSLHQVADIVSWLEDEQTSLEYDDFKVRSSINEIRGCLKNAGKERHLIIHEPGLRRVIVGLADKLD